MLSFAKTMRSRSGVQAGFTLIELILVVTIIAFVYGVALPQLNLKSGAEMATKTGQLAGDIRNGFDLAVLTGKTHRLVIMFNSGEYWLEQADRAFVYLGDDKLGRDPTAEEEKEAAEIFENEFIEIEELAGEIVVDPEEEKEIKPISPLIEAKDKLKPPVWTRIQSMEWSGRSIGPFMMVQSMQAEHHGQMQTIDDLGEEARGFIYFFPEGYVEKAVIHIAVKKEDFVPDDEEEPFTLITSPYNGTATVYGQYREVDVHRDEDES